MTLVRNDFPTPASPLTNMWNGLESGRSFLLFNGISWEYLIMIKLNSSGCFSFNRDHIWQNTVQDNDWLSVKLEATGTVDGWLGPPYSSTFKSSKSGLSTPWSLGPMFSSSWSNKSWSTPSRTSPNKSSTSNLP